MKGHKWELFVLSLSFIGWYLLVALTCGILSLWIVPYVNVVMANYYDELVHPGGEEQAEPETEKVETAEVINEPEITESKVEPEAEPETEEIETATEEVVPEPEEKIEEAAEETETIEQEVSQEEVTEEPEE